MKLFVIHKQNRNKQYLGVTASSRQELSAILGSPYFNVENQLYHVNDVLAEDSSSNTAAGLIIGGILGILAGPIGVIGGAALGGMIGNSNDSSEKDKVSLFNSSHL